MISNNKLNIILDAVAFFTGLFMIPLIFVVSIYTAIERNVDALIILGLAVLLMALFLYLVVKTDNKSRRERR